MNNTKLVIAPHVDDDILGCGGIIDKNTIILYCGIDETGIPNRPDFKERIKEANDVKDYLKSEYILLDNKVNNYKIQNLIGQIESVINDLRPDEVYIPHPSYNQDHKAVYDASLIALRPHDINFFVSTVLVYEQPHLVLWDNTGNTFKPNYFQRIDVEKKITAYKLMKTQVRSFRSPETIRALALLRGKQSNFNFAEAFEILRMCK